MPDASFVAHHRTVMLDVSVVCAYSKSNVNNKNRIPTREKQKIRKFGKQCAAKGYDFIPAGCSKSS
jgi:predicted Rossmann-fold nucleotide-binding protein